LRDNWNWRKQIARLSLFDLKKKSRGAVLSWGWFFIKPGMYIFCFWFALEIGLRVGNSDAGAPPYILWLCAGLIPWFFMQDMINQGSDVLHRYPYLVNKIKFPLSGISTISDIATTASYFSGYSSARFEAYIDPQEWPMSVILSLPNVHGESRSFQARPA
jgi:teichoic acid transport system permease protein